MMKRVWDESSRTRIATFFRYAELDDYLLSTDVQVKFSLSKETTRKALETLEQWGVCEKFLLPGYRKRFGYRKPGMKKASASSDKSQKLS